MTNPSGMFFSLLKITFSQSKQTLDLSSESEKKPYLKQASISPDGSKIAFTYTGDIWVVSANGGIARRITSHPSYDSHPIFSPDGTKLAFASNRTGGGNIYLTDLEQNDTPTRLTFHSGASPPDCWSPDSKWIYFTSNYGGIGGYPYKISVNGNTPIEIGGDPMETHYHLATSPDGSTLAFNNNGHPWWRHGQNPAGHSDIWIADESGVSNHRRLTQYQGRNLRPMWNADGSKIYFLSDRDSHENIWLMSLNGDGDAEQITNFTDLRMIRPSISAKGNWIVFERNFQIWKLDLNQQQATPIEITVNSDEKFSPVRNYTTNSEINEYHLSPDGKKVAFIAHGSIFADLSEKGDKIKKGGNSFKVTDTPFRESQLSWHPDSDSIIYVSDRLGNNQIFSYNFRDQVEKQLTDQPDQKYLPKYSPDGKWLAYIQEKTEIWLINTQTEDKFAFIINQIFTGVPFPTDFEWSPDSQWIVFIAQDNNFFSNIYVQNIEALSSQQLTFLSNISSHNIVWSPNGKFIIFNTGQYRTENQIVRVDLKPIQPTFKEEDFDKLFEESEGEKQKEETPKEEKNDQDQSDTSKNGNKDSKKNKEIEPTEIELGTIKRRAIFLTDFKLNAQALQIRPDSKTLIFQASFTGQPNLWSMSLEEEKKRDLPKQLTWSADKKRQIYFTPNGKRIHFLENGRIHFLDIEEDGSKDGDQKVLDTQSELEVDFHLEKIQSFDEAWRLIRDYFYDPNFHGCNWKQVYDQFRPIMQGVQTGSDFQEILNLMVGELNASHLGTGGTGYNSRDSYLGVDFDRDQLENHNHFQINFVLPESPLSLPPEPAKSGEFLVAVDGIEINQESNLNWILQDKSSKRIKIHLNDKPQLEEARELVVKPINAKKHGQLRYQYWVRWNADYVDQKSNGRLGYAHIRSMSYSAYIKFTADLDTETHNKEGVVIDVRFNGGGHIAPFILDVLNRKAYTQSSYRQLVTTSDSNLAGNRIIQKPLILITNEHSGSNTEMFSQGFKTLGLGKVVGMPTSGAVIWTWNWHLLNNVTFRLPRMKVSTETGENLEGNARPVDIEVDRILGELNLGIDRQLNTAVAELLDQIDGSEGEQL